jgi:hypothetical protein
VKKYLFETLPGILTGERRVALTGRNVNGGISHFTERGLFLVIE